MKFRTEIETPEFDFRIRHCARPVVLLGSCFSDEIGRRLKDDLFNVVANPLGPLFNPLSIKRVLDFATDARTLSENEFFQLPQTGRWRCWLASTDFEADSFGEIFEIVSRRLLILRQALLNAQAVFVTLGSTMAYFLPDATVVSNCHKQPASRFSRSEMDITQVSRILDAILNMTGRHHTVFTVSPVRHVSYSLHRNAVMKAVLLAAVDSIDDALYFPAYEALIDDLRDYRFYADDLVHPSKFAVDYVYEIFDNAFFDPEEKDCFDDCRAWSRLAAHRPLKAEFAEAHNLRVSMAKNQLIEKHGLYYLANN